MIEVILKGAGEATVGLVDRRGRMLMTMRLVLSGSEGIEARSTMPLVLQTREEEIAVVPVLISTTGSNQRVTFGGLEHGTFTSRRCEELNITRGGVDDARELAEKQASGGVMVTFVGQPTT